MVVNRVNRHRNRQSVSQEILPLGNFAAAANFPRKYGGVVSGERQYFLGNIAAFRK